MNSLLKSHRIRIFGYITIAVILSFAAKGIGTGTAVYGWILGITVAISLADAVAPMAKSVAKTTLIALLRIALPLVAKHINPEEVVASVGTAQGISVSALNAAVGSKGIFGLEALRAILAGAETDTVSLRAMVRGIALAVIKNGWEFTAITEAEQLDARAEEIEQAARSRKSEHQQAYDDQVRRAADQLKIKLSNEDEIIGQQTEVRASLSPLLSVAPKTNPAEWVN